MTDNKNQSHRSLLNGYIEQIVAVQSSIQELSAEQTQIRSDARTDGFNVEAVQLLSQIVAKSPHDKGLRLLQDTVKYAHEIGIELGTVSVEAKVESNENGTAPKDEEVYPPRFRAAHLQIDRRLVLLFQLGLGAGIAWMFLSLLS